MEREKIVFPVISPATLRLSSLFPLKTLYNDFARLKSFETAVARVGKLRLEKKPPPNSEVKSANERSSRVDAREDSAICISSGHDPLSQRRQRGASASERTARKVDYGNGSRPIDRIRLDALMYRARYRHR